jgi:hypothetical protein
LFDRRAIDPLTVQLLQDLRCGHAELKGQDLEPCGVAGVRDLSMQDHHCGGGQQDSADRWHGSAFHLQRVSARRVNAR